MPQALFQSIRKVEYQLKYIQLFLKANTDHSRKSRKTIYVGTIAISIKVKSHNLIFRVKS